MLVYKNKEFRNLQEQVAKNMRDIQNIMQGTTVLAEFGIKVIGQVDTAMELPDPATYEGEYGDAYIVGTEEPYEYYIFTRAFEGQDEPSWFDLGIFPVPGPQGEQGPEGPQGPQGQTGNPGQDGTSAGFGTVSATASTLPAGSDATVSVVASGPNTEKSFAFTFGIPEGEPGEDASCEWGSISGDISDQTDLVNALQAKQNASNAMTTNTEQTVSAKKTFANPVEFTTSDVTFGNGTITTIPGTIRTDKTNNYGVNVPSTSAFEANKTLATTDQLFSGSYNDLTDKPSIPSVSGTNDGTNWTSITINSDTYDIPQGGGTGTVTDVEVDGVSVVNAQGVAEITMPDLSDYVTSTELSTELADYTPTANLASVATSGDYDDLTNKPDLSVYAESADLGDCAYLDEDELSIAYSQITDTPTIPTNTSDLNNDSGFITSSALSGYAQLAAGTSSVPQEFTGYNTFTHTLNTALIIAGGNIRPSSNATYSLGNANQRWDRIYVDNYIMNYSKLKTNNSDSYGVVCPNTSSYTANKTIATTDDIPSLTGYATETWVTNQGYITGIDSSDVIAALGYTPGTSNFSGSYTDLTDKPTIPTDTSDLTNGAGFITSSVDNLTNYYDKTDVDDIVDNVAEDIPTYTSDLINDSGFITSSALATVATTGDYDDLLNKPTIPTVPVQDVTVNGTSVVSSGTAAVSVPTSASTTVSASSETFTFTYADGTTTTKTFLTAITSATTTLS